MSFFLGGGASEFHTPQLPAFPAAARDSQSLDCPISDTVKSGPGLELTLLAEQDSGAIDPAKMEMAAAEVEMLTDVL